MQVPLFLWGSSSSPVMKTNSYPSINTDSSSPTRWNIMTLGEVLAVLKKKGKGQEKGRLAWQCQELREHKRHWDTFMWKKTTERRKEEQHCGPWTTCLCKARRDFFTEDSNLCWPNEKNEIVLRFWWNSVVFLKLSGVMLHSVLSVCLDQAGHVKLGRHPEQLTTYQKFSEDQRMN